MFYSFSQTAVGLYGEERNMPIPRHEGIIKNKLERRMCVCVCVCMACVCVCTHARTPYEPHRSVVVFFFTPLKQQWNSRDTCLTARAHCVLQCTRPTQTGERAHWPDHTPLPVVCRCCSHCHTASTAGRGVNHAPSVRTCRAEGGAASAWCVVT